MTDVRPVPHRPEAPTQRPASERASDLDAEDAATNSLVAERPSSLDRTRTLLRQSARVTRLIQQKALLNAIRPAAVDRLLRGSASQDADSPGTSTVPRGAAGVIQRKVGFELESGTWSPWLVEARQVKKQRIGKDKHLTKLRSAKRKEVVHADPSGYFTLEGDDSRGATKPDIEFVTKAFDLTKQGMAEMEPAFGEIRAITNRIGRYAGRAGNPPKETFPFYKSKPLAHLFVGHDEHGLPNPDLYFSQLEEAGSAKFKMQATQGLSLEEVEPFMAHLGTRESRAFMFGDQKLKPGDEGLLNILGGVPQLVDVALDYLERKDVVKRGAEGTAALRGFLSTAIMYVKALSSESMSVKQAKYFIPLLARTNMAKLFTLVPDSKRLPPDALAEAIVRAANSKRYIEVGTADTGFAVDKTLVRSPILGLASLTIGDWVNGIVTGGVDYLNAVTIGSFLDTTATERNKAKPPSALEKKQASSALESFAALGTDPYSDKTDKPDVEKRTEMGIFENRFIDRYMTIEEAAGAAMDYMNMIARFKGV